MTLTTPVLKTPKRHNIARNRVFWHILREGQCWGLGCGRKEEPKKKRNNSRTWGVIFHPYGKKITPGPIWTKFCTEGDIMDVITLANFGVDWFRGFSVARGQILGFSISFRRLPYNTVALSCECMIQSRLPQQRIIHTEQLWFFDDGAKPKYSGFYRYVDGLCDACVISPQMKYRVC